MERSLADRLTDPVLLHKLEASGYESVKDIKDVGVIQVIEELQLTEKEVTLILELVHGGQIRASQTVEDRLKADTKKSGISFSCEPLDALFGTYKGVLPSCVTEICGESGTGKTQLCMQLAINVQLQNDQTPGECIYIDTEGSMFPTRLRQIADHAAKVNIPFDAEPLLRRVHLFRVFDHIELVALIRQLPNILRELVNVKLVILDSVAFPMRLNITDSRLRTSLLGFFGQNLAQLASRHKVSVVVTNHITMDRINSALTPALGPSWGNWCGNRLFLYRKRERRYAFYYKSSLGIQAQTVQFRITNNGLEAPLNPEPHGTANNEEVEDDEDGTQLYTSLPVLSARNITTANDSSTEEQSNDDQDMWKMEHFTDQVPSQPSGDNNNIMQEMDLTTKESQLKRKRENYDDELAALDPDSIFCWSSAEEEDYRFLEAYNSPTF